MYMIRVHIGDLDNYTDSFFDTLEEAIEVYEDMLCNSRYETIAFIKLYKCLVDAATGTIYIDDISKSDIVYP